MDGGSRDPRAGRDETPCRAGGVHGWDNLRKGQSHEREGYLHSMRPEASKKLIAKMSTAERIEIARSKADQMWKFVLGLIQTHANNRIITCSDVLSDQIGISQAAHAFNDFQEIMYVGELVKLC